MVLIILCSRVSLHLRRWGCGLGFARFGFAFSLGCSVPGAGRKDLTSCWDRSFFGLLAFVIEVLRDALTEVRVELSQRVHHVIIRHILRTRHLKRASNGPGGSVLPMNPKPVTLVLLLQDASPHFELVGDLQCGTRGPWEPPRRCPREQL